MTESPLAALHQAAEAVRQQLRLPTFDAAAVEYLARFLEAQRAAAGTDHAGLTTALGCFLGQCLVETYNGQWAAGPDGTTGVGINGTSFFNPFYRVAEQLAHGPAKSVADFFASVPARVAAAPNRQN